MFKSIPADIPKQIASSLPAFPPHGLLGGTGRTTAYTDKMRHREKEHKIQNREGVCKVTSFQINNKPLWSFSCFCLGNSCHQRQSVRGKKKKIPAVQAKKKRILSAE